MLTWGIAIGVGVVLILAAWVILGKRKGTLKRRLDQIVKLNCESRELHEKKKDDLSGL